MLQNSFIAFLVVLVFSFSIYQWISLPIVQWSWSKDKCVQVIGNGTCDKLPKKYEIEWVR